jgi:hypothetical protein
VHVGVRELFEGLKLPAGFSGNGHLRERERESESGNRKLRDPDISHMAMAET